MLRPRSWVPVVAAKGRVVLFVEGETRHSSLTWNQATAEWSFSEGTPTSRRHSTTDESSCGLYTVTHHRLTKRRDRSVVSRLTEILVLVGGRPSPVAFAFPALWPASPDMSVRQTCDLPLLRGNTASMRVSLFGMFENQTLEIQCLQFQLGYPESPSTCLRLGRRPSLGVRDILVELRPAGILCTGREREERQMLRCPYCEWMSPTIPRLPIDAPQDAAVRTDT